MFKKISTVALICFGLAACGGEAMDKFVADNAAKEKAPAAPAAAAAPAKPAPTKCETSLKKLDGDILAAYTKLSPTQFDKVGQLRDQLASACAAKADDAKVDALVAEAAKVMTTPAPAPAKKAAAKKAPAKK